MFDKFLISLEIMWKGMLGIFIVLTIIMLIVMLLSILTKKH
jgi:hypothetical protein